MTASELERAQVAKTKMEAFAAWAGSLAVGGDMYLRPEQLIENLLGLRYDVKEAELAEQERADMEAEAAVRAEEIAQEAALQNPQPPQEENGS